MKKIACHYKKIRFTYIVTTMITLFVCLFFVDGFVAFEKTGENYFHIMINGTEIGTTGDRETAERLLIEARKRIASQNQALTFMEADMTLTGEEVLWGTVDNEKTLVARMEECLRDNILQTTHRSYTLKVNEYMVNLSGADEVQALLQAAVDKYDVEHAFQVDVKRDTNREFNVLTAGVLNTAQQEEEEEEISGANGEAGVEVLMSRMGLDVETGSEKEFSDYELGLLTMNFAEKVEIVECYLPENQLKTLEEAIDEVIKEQETAAEYEVVSGDTLSEISIKVNIPMDRIVEMNEALEDENTAIRVGQKLIITVPEPELSVERVEQNYYEEIYDADIIYVDEDSWYTNQTEVLQQPSAGFRKVVADVSYLNDKEISREILKEEIVIDAVPKIVRRGTKIPPTYIRPISGGRQTSGFGRRKAPTRGASSYHRGVDWATPTGTPVYASSGGTVAKAGWGSGYGYVVYIDHADGRQTRYAHLSKVLVSAGQTVKQGDRIALSGNTGVSTGPHLHFEMVINGTRVNPLNYLN